MTNQDLEQNLQQLLKENKEVAGCLMEVGQCLKASQARMERLEAILERTIDLMEKIFDNSDQAVSVMRDLTDVVRQTNGSVSENTNLIEKVIVVIEGYFGDGSSVRYTH